MLARNCTCVSLLAALLAIMFGLPNMFGPSFPVHRSGAVFITGCSSGIGKHAALGLAEAGYDVFATVRKQDDVKQLMAGASAQYAERLHPVLCDVTNQSQVLSARDQVASWLSAVEGRVLAGVINNAGISAPLELQEFIPIARIDSVFDVNVRSPLLVYQVFLPLLRGHGRGRVINIGSLAGQNARMFSGAYTISKFALEGLSDTQRRELLLEGIAVSMVNPGYVVSEIGEKKLSFTRESEQAGDYDKFNDLQKRMLQFTRKFEEHGLEARSPASTTTSAIIEALRSPRPRARYYPGSCGVGSLSAEVCMRIIPMLPSGILDMVLARAAPEKM